ncbi:MAG TPA: pyridoxamine 5'-phosphate oxidase family protein [Candidatus Limnocylindrales bacterium]|nr:pyridoxamine 5'-phosphate oxidase family protein [Candidatus Limnocylindrales bacterium]
MASWGEFESAQPEFARRVKRLLTTRKHLTMATLRRDGSPRISGTEVQFAGDQLTIGSMLRAVKAADLMRDPRVAIHGPTHDPTNGGRWRGEAKVAGKAVEVRTEGDAHAFRIDISEVVVTHLSDAGDRLVIESWHPTRGYRQTDRD